MFKEEIFWQETITPLAVQQPAPLPGRAEVVIIGAGLTGLSAARTLAQHGVPVVVLEAESLGWGASSRNGGMVLTGLKPSMQTVFKKYGRTLARQLFQCSLEAIDTVERTVREEKIECGFSRSGHLLVASKPKHAEALRTEAEFLAREFDYSVRILPRSELHTEIDSPIYHEALLDERSGGLNPAQYVAGLAHAAERAGARLCTRARVIRLERQVGGFIIHTARGRLLAERVLVATAGYTGRATPSLHRKIIPIGSFIIASEKLPADLASQLIPRRRMIFDSRHYLHYFRLWDNRLIFGGRAAFFPETPDTVRASAEILRREMIAVFPQLKGVEVEYAWGGTLDFTTDLLPHVGEINGLHYALGYAGHGVALATYLGGIAAKAILGDNVRDHPFAMLSFPDAPLGKHTRWVLPLLGLGYRVLDWVD